MTEEPLEKAKVVNLKLSPQEYLFLSEIKEELKKLKGKNKISWEETVIELAKRYRQNKEKDLIMELELEAGQFLKKLSLLNINEEKIAKIKDYLFAVIEGNKEWEEKAKEELCYAK